MAIVLVFAFFFFFFKQKTAYEMRISDWSSDVCSSDLRFVWGFALDAKFTFPFEALGTGAAASSRLHLTIFRPQLHFVDLAGRGERHRIDADDRVGNPPGRDAALQRREQVVVADRSEEHTSELQSLMRNSYAVFCLTKKKKEKAHKTAQTYNNT